MVQQFPATTRLSTLTPPCVQKEHKLQVIPLCPFLPVVVGKVQNESHLPSQLLLLCQQVCHCQAMARRLRQAPASQNLIAQGCLSAKGKRRAGANRVTHRGMGVKEGSILHHVCTDCMVCICIGWIQGVARTWRESFQALEACACVFAHHIAPSWV